MAGANGVGGPSSFLDFVEEREETEPDAGEKNTRPKDSSIDWFARSLGQEEY